MFARLTSLAIVRPVAAIGRRSVSTLEGNPHIVGRQLPVKALDRDTDIPSTSSQTRVVTSSLSSLRLLRSQSLLLEQLRNSLQQQTR